MDRVSLPFSAAKATKPFVVRSLTRWAVRILRFPDWRVQSFSPNILLSVSRPQLLSTSRKAHAGATRITDLQKQAHRPTDCTMDFDMCKEFQAKYRVRGNIMKKSTSAIFKDVV